jgi:hypothetical protein
LHEHGVAGLEVALGEEHPVRRQPRGRQARGLGERQRRGLGDHVRPRHHDVVGERALVPLAEQRPLRVEGLVAGPGGIVDDGVDDDLVAVLVVARGVAAEDHRQRLLAQAHTAQRPQVVVVEGRGLHADPSPPGRDLGIRSLADHEAGQWVVGGELLGIHGEHVPTLAGPTEEARRGEAG